MKPYQIISTVILIIGLTAFFSQSIAKQAPKKSPDQSKSLENKATTDSKKKIIIQLLKMELVQKGNKLYLKLNRGAKGVWLDQKRKGAKSLGRGNLIEVTPVLSRAKGGKLTFFVIDTAGRKYTQKLPVSKYNSLLKPEKPEKKEKKKPPELVKKEPAKKAPSQKRKPSVKQPMALSPAQVGQGMPEFKVKRVFSKDGSLHVTIIRMGAGPLTSKSARNLKLKIDSKDLKLNKTLITLAPHWKTALAKKREFDIDTGLKVQKRQWVTATIAGTGGVGSSKKFLMPAVKGRDVKTAFNNVEEKTAAKGKMHVQGKQFLNTDKKNMSQQAGMPAQRPEMMGTTADRMDPTPEDRIVGSPVASTGSIRKLAEESAKLKPVSEYARAQAPQLPEEPPEIEQIAEGIVIEVPTAGTKVRAGNIVTIRWEYMESVFEEYRDRPMSVDLYARSTADPTDIVWTFMAGSDREIDWHIASDTPAGIYVIGARFDSGMTVFTGNTHIEVLSSSDLVLVWPPEANTGETILYVGYNYPITWNAYGDADDQPLNVELMDGSALFDVLASGINPPSERYDWLVGGDCNSSAMVPRGEDFRIRISTTDGPTHEDLSAPFTIRLPTIAIDVRPRAGERWRIGNSYHILWNSDHVPEGATVKLSLLKGGSYELLIEENQPNTGGFLWEEAGIEKYTGPVTSGSIAQSVAPPDDDYSIRIEMEDCDLVYGISPVFELYE